jgi:hypothetical protein
VPALPNLEERKADCHTFSFFVFLEIKRTHSYPAFCYSVLLVRRACPHFNKKVRGKVWLDESKTQKDARKG